MSVLEEHSQNCPLDAGFEPIVGDSGLAPRRRSELAAQRISALGEMTTGLAHDFRNILAVINSAINLAESSAGDATKAAAAFAAAHEGIRRGSTLAAKLVAFATPRLADAQAENINGLIENLRLFLDYAAGPDIKVRLDLAPAMPACRVDAAQFGAALLNLVVNARDSMPEGGEIRISTALIRLSETEDSMVDPRCILVRIIDQGQGMPKEISDRIFDPYFTTKGELGTGLGVPQVLSFMRTSGGCMNVSSETGSGTMFDLYFPICDSPGLVGTSLWRQLDRWTNEGGQSRSAPPRCGH